MSQVAVIQQGPVLAMSSREIAALVESRHDNVKRTIERLGEKGVIRFTPSEETSHAGAGARPVSVYLVDKRDSFVVVAQAQPGIHCAPGGPLAGVGVSASAWCARRPYESGGCTEAGC